MKVKNNINISLAEKKIKAGIGLYAHKSAKKMEGYAKKDKPWTDRSSNAKDSIQGDFSWQGKKAVITLSGNVNYFVFLELANAKKYAVLVPTIQRYAPEVLKGYQKLVR